MDFKLDRRVCRRVAKQLGAHFSRFTLQDSVSGWEECSITNISHSFEGIGVKFHTRERIRLKSYIAVEIFVEGELEPIRVKGIVKWIRRKGDDFVGGIELIEKNYNLAKLFVDA